MLGSLGILGSLGSLGSLGPKTKEGHAPGKKDSVRAPEAPRISGRKERTYATGTTSSLCSSNLG